MENASPAYNNVNSYGQSNTGSGYTCLSCGTWVLEGNSHSCTFRYWPQQPVVQYYPAYQYTSLEEVLKELRAIKKLLEEKK